MQRDTKTLPLKEILTRLAPVKSIRRATHQHKRLDQLLKAVLPSLLSNYCEAGALSEQTFTIRAYSPAIATHLRLSTPKLIEKLRRYPELSSLQEITIQIAAPPVEETMPTRSHPVRPNRVSEGNCNLIENTANEVSSPELRDALQRLATTLRSKRSKNPRT
ncbi:hypothetical protein HDN1F_06780 [gamma proteobacterium HdN1]|nr:hypothetical protein HDN1F_06780 [gamma proteobacterium HdN1]